MSFRVIYHEPRCPDCGSTDIISDDVPTGDGLTETAHTCRACGAAWPVACVCEWTKNNDDWQGEAEAEAWGGRVPSPGYTYADWLAEGQAEAEA